MLERLSKFLLGYDFFISYAYLDGQEYASALSEKLANLDYACFFDASELPPGEQLPSSLRRAIRRSKAVVLVGTEGSIDAPYVNLEVSYALGQGKVIPIDVDGIRERVTSGELRELPWVNEESGGTSKTGPSVSVLGSVSSYFNFRRRNIITRQIVSAMATVFFIVAVFAVWQWRIAIQQRVLAEQQRDIALSGQLAGQSKAFLDKEPDLAMLLAAAAGQLGDTFEARDALLRGLQRYSGLVRLIHDAGSVAALAFSPDGERLASSVYRGGIFLWDVSSGDRIASLFMPDKRRVDSLVFDEDGKTLVAWGKEEVLAAWDLLPDGPRPRLDADGFSRSVPNEGDITTSLLKRIREDDTRIRKSAITRRGDILATVDGEAIRLWSTRSGEEIGESFSVQEKYVRALAFSSNRILASGSSSGTIALWDFGNSLKFNHVLKGLEISTNSFSFSHDGKQLAGGDYYGRIALWPLDQLSARPRFLNHKSNVHALQYGSSDQLASIGSGELKIWNPVIGKLERTIALKTSSASAVDQKIGIAASGGNSGELVLWDITKGERLPAMNNKHTDRLLAAAFHPNGTVLATAGNGRSVHLLEIATGETVAELDGHTSAVADLDFSADGSRLASYDSDGTLIIWDMKRLQPIGKQLQRTEQYSGSSAMALSPDGKTAVTSDKNGALNLWHVDTWRPLGNPILAHSGAVTTLEFSADGNWLASGSLGGQVFLWDLRIDTWIEHVCTIANRVLTPHERSIYLVDSGFLEKSVCN